MGWIEWVRRPFPQKRPAEAVDDGASSGDKAVASPPASIPKFAWDVVAASVRGATHVRRETPNQDAVLWRRQEGEEAFTVLAVSDGHGSAKCFRSDRGAELAVEIGVEETLKMLSQEMSGVDLSSMKRMVVEQLPRKLSHAWKEAVEQELEDRPLLARETAQVAIAQDPATRDSVERSPIVAYGATLLVVAIHPEFIAALQLGDGDILQVDAAGKVERLMDEDSRLLANETTSLSAEHAWRDFRCSFSPLVDRPPALLLAATDGYSNSFNTDADFLRVGTDLLELLRDEGVDYVQENLAAWLEIASTQGSGDDVTAGLLYCPDAQLQGDANDPVTESSTPASLETEEVDD